MSAKAILSASVSAAPKVYIEDVFSTFLYTGNGGTQTITNGIALANGFSITPGTALAGGFFAGYISHTANSVATHALIVAPAATGASGTGYTITTNLAWKTTNTTTAGTTSSFNGSANSANMNDANHPAAQFCENLSIGGYSDWYMPARYELDIAYENLKPTSTSNNTSFGINPYSVPARTVNRTAGAPAQTTVTAFQTGGAEAFIADNHWSSTEDSSTLAWMRNFGDGDEFNGSKTDTRRVRAFRKIPINDPLITAYAVTGEGGLVWCKNRTTGSTDNILTATPGKALKSNLTNAEQTTTRIDSFNSNGFFINNGSTDINQSSENYCSWTFRKAPKFFDVVTYTGDGNASKTISHNLGSTPGFLIVKRTDSTGQWQCYHRSLTSTSYYIQLNQTSGQQTVGAQAWDVSSTNFTVYGAATDTNINNATYVAYLFAHDAGGFGDAGTDSVVSCGSYTGNGSTSGPTVTLGWEPQWMMIKHTTSSGGWFIFDNMRGMVSGGNDSYLRAESNSEEFTSSNDVTPLATGFALSSASGGTNDPGSNYIYIAIRRGPMKTPESGTEVFAPTLITATQATQNITSVGFSPDMIINGVRSDANYGQQVTDRLRGVNKQLFTEYTSAEGTTNGTALVSLNMNGFTLGSDSAGSGWNAYSGFRSIKWSFRRAPGFFDVVAYTGTGTTQNVQHNLGVAPQLIINKSRSADANFGWPVYAEPLGNGQVVRLNATDATGGSGGWNTTSPTATQFTVNGYNNNSVTYIAYLFATCPGVSKVGTYTGTGTGYTVDVNCGFTTGARFVLIKRTDSTGDWFVWDTARGIISGNDPYLLLNSTAAEVTNTDFIDPLSTGFQISSTAPAAINANGGTYIFLAIS